MSKEIFVRLSVSDIVLSKEEADNLSNYAEIKDKEGKVVTETELYVVTYEDEDGDECDEDGNKL